MPEDEKSGGGIGGYIRGVRADIRSLSQKAVAGGLLVKGGLLLSAIMTGLATWLKGTTELERGLLWGAAITPLFFVVPLVLLAMWRQRPASRETVLRLRGLYGACRPTIAYAIGFMEADIFDAAIGHPDKRVVAELSRGFILTPYKEKVKTLDGIFAYTDRAYLTGAELAAASTLLSQVLTAHYETLLTWIVNAGEGILGLDRLISSERYAKLCSAHADFIKAITPAATWPEFKKSFSQLRSTLPSPKSLTPGEP